MSKAQSGLGSLKRDWSNASSSSAASSSQLTDWQPTQPEKEEPVDEKTERTNKRLLVIRQALASMNDAPVQSNPSSPVPLDQSTVTNRATGKRPSPDSVDTAPTKKKRDLPPSWREDTLSNPSFSRANLAARIKSTNESTSRRGESGSGETRFSAPSSSVGSSSSSSTKPAKLAKLFLSQEQTHILKLVKEGYSVFYTGSAGIAACNVGGITIHSFAGIGLGIETAEKLADRVKKNKKALMRWLKTKVLIIDEVSMVDGELFDKLAKIGSIVRKKPSEPFGGIQASQSMSKQLNLCLIGCLNVQVVVTGDFFQLPPVNKAGGQMKFAFEAEAWHSTIQRTFNLTKVFRQKDQEFVDMLNEMRFGRLSSKSIAKFRSLSRNIVYEDGLGPTELFPRREDVERSNGLRMQHLETEELKFVSSDGGTLVDPDHRNKMLSNFMAPKELRLRIDAQVMLIKNVDEQLVNGTMGRVTRFIDPVSYTAETGYDIANGAGATNAIPKKSGTGARYPEVEFSLANGQKRLVLVTPETWKVELPSGEIQVSRTQFPLILAWAMSIHKSQGQTLDRVKVDLSRVFEKGQAYVALSRATSLEGLQVLNFEPSKVSAHEKVAKWTLTLETISDD
ncbi:hypothetical protein D9756_002301 [Leucocoprinus leucothites]|uniref:ATP-dependent DNA helicase PIF1 n=1 Tax=Leucocoprinus leucothites TaxID=201217 RepID=A0A8H5GCJ7_9AGAR|nr:hypothetical protein D9756_002301 [Leucoagaricus leucothites]